MIGLRRRLRRRDRGVAAVEFAVAAPVMLFFLGGIVDFGMIYYGQSRVSAGVAAGAQYAILTGATVTQSNIQTLVQNAAGLSNLTVTVTGLSPTACYCVSGTPPATVAATCGTNCANGAAAGTYAFITATYAYQPIMPAYSRLSSPQVVEAATVQVQ